MPENTHAPAQPDPTPTWASLATAARYWDCSEDTIRRRVADGTLTARKFGPRLIRVKLEG